MTYEVFCVFSDSKNNLWVGTYDGLKKFNLKTHKFKHYETVSNTENATENIIRTIYEDKKGKIWLGTEDGVSCLDAETDKVVPYKIKNIYGNESLLGRVTSIIQDNSKNLWIGSQYGLFKIYLKKSKFKNYKRSTENLSVNRIHSIFLENDSLLWLGTRNDGFTILNRYTNEKEEFGKNKKNFISDNSIHSISKLNDEKIWITTSNGVFRFNQKTRKTESLSEIYKKDFSPWFYNNRISNMIIDKNNNYWFATFNGLIFFDGKDIKTFKNRGGSKTQIPSNEIVRVIESNTGEIWVGSLEGLSKYLPESENFDNYSKDLNGLSNNSILYIFESSDGTI